jgi:hypothetical protein
MLDIYTEYANKWMLDIYAEYANTWMFDIYTEYETFVVVLLVLY